MPIYEYVCEKCGKHIEVMQKVSDDPLKRCSECRGKLEKVISRTSFQLKGSGWYMTDYSRGGPATKKTDKAESDSKKKAESSSSSDATCGSGACGKCE
jgi:putative FmdB family regulatory protein